MNSSCALLMVFCLPALRSFLALLSIVSIPPRPPDAMAAPHEIASGRHKQQLQPSKQTVHAKQVNISTTTWHPSRVSSGNAHDTSLHGPRQS
mmetsp:Transcript_19899/g.39049  ORF Transcript_19899/g.39049 Transcript_19899/m.39049 type:complete len:92 (-) Transcript_19899:11-286(-)